MALRAQTIIELFEKAAGVGGFDGVALRKGTRLAIPVPAPVAVHSKLYCLQSHRGNVWIDHSVAVAATRRRDI